MSHAWNTFLREKCVDVRSLSISCSFLLLRRLTFSDVSQLPFQSSDLGNPQGLHSFAPLKYPRGCLTRGTHFYVKSAWM